MSTVVEQARKRNGGLWGKQTFIAVIVNDRLWVDCVEKLSLVMLLKY
jgi:hypothetical protein